MSPEVCVAASRTVIGLSKSKKSPASLTTFVFLNSGINLEIGSLNLMRPRSTRIIRATPVIGLDIE